MIHNVHERFLPAAGIDAVGALLDTLGSSHDAVWPRDDWPPMVLDRSLGVGASGGHADIRYTVECYEPSRRVVFRFDPACGLRGTHAFEVGHRSDGVLLRHDLTARALGMNRLLYPLVIRPIHDAMVEDAFDRVHERLVPGTPRTHWSPYVRLLRRLAGLAPRPLHAAGAVRPVVPPRDGLLAGASWDYADAFAVDLPAGASADPEVWRREVLATPPAALRRLMHLRDLLVLPLGLRRSSDRSLREGFPVLARRDDEVLVGVDDRHLDFRVSIRVLVTANAPTVLVVTTTVTFQGRLGRLYFLPVRPFHRRIVPALLHRAVTSGQSLVAVHCSREGTTGAPRVY